MQQRLASTIFQLLACQFRGCSSAWIVLALTSSLVIAQDASSRRLTTLQMPQSIAPNTQQTSHRVDYSQSFGLLAPRLARQPAAKADDAAPTPPTDANDTTKAEEVAKPRVADEHLPNAILSRKSITEITTNIDLPQRDQQPLELPKNLASDFFQRQETFFQQPDFQMPGRHLAGLRTSMSGALRMPVYFEEENFERHGTSRGILQPAVSGAHFFKNVVALPYKMVVEPPRQSRIYDYPYEAGRVAPRYYRPYPLRVDASVAEAALIIGLIAIIP